MFGLRMNLAIALISHSQIIQNPQQPHLDIKIKIKILLSNCAN